MSTAGQVICLGDVMVDVLARLPGPLAIGSDTPAPIDIRPGGSAANTACWLAQLGSPVVFAGRVGADVFGRDACAALVAAGVTPRVSVAPDTPTGVCLVLVGPDGERTMIPSAGANAELAPEDVRDLVHADDHLHLSAYSLLHPGSRRAALTVLDQAVQGGARVSVDAASAAPIRQLGGARLIGWLPAGTLLLANADEFAALTGDDPRAVDVLLDRGFHIVVKYGARGCQVIDRSGSRRIGTEPVATLDSTGAGDAFAAGLLAALRTGSDLDTAAANGNRIAARALRVLGGRPVLPD